MRTHRVLTAAGLAALVLSSCSFLGRVARLDFVDLPDTRVANLEALHLPSGQHRYAADLQGDWEYVSSRTGRRVAGLHIGERKRVSTNGKREDAIRNPSEVCLELLNELLDFDSSERPRLRATQIAWCARLLDEDPALLTRERAALGLGALGAGLDVGPPRQLADSEPRASADDVGAGLSRLIAAYRRERDGHAGLGERDVPPLPDVIDELLGRTYDLGGARRMLIACAAILNGADPQRAETRAVTQLVTEFERRTIALALGRGLAEDGLVRGATADAVARCCDQAVYAQLMDVLRVDADTAGLYRFLQVLLDHGLPQPSQELAGERYAMARREWTETLLGIAVQNRESYVRARAMQVLTAALPEGPGTLREEDWEAWWFARAEGEAAEAAATEGP